MDRAKFLQNTVAHAQHIIDELDRTGNKQPSDMRTAAVADVKYYGEQLEQEQQASGS